MVIYNGVNPNRTGVQPGETAAARAELGLPEGSPVAGIVARLVDGKDHFTFLRAAARVHESVPDCHFLVVGEGPMRARLEEEAAALGIVNRTHFVGTRVRVAPLIDCMDVAVLSSQDLEGCSNFLLEAMALARPLVATDIGGNRELVQDGENGYLVPCRDPQAMAGAITSLLEDGQLAERMGGAGEKRSPSVQPSADGERLRRTVREAPRPRARGASAGRFEPAK